MKLSPDLENYRITYGTFKSEPKQPFGLFQVPHKSTTLKVIAYDGKADGWEHVSVSLPNRTPNWGEMCFIKGLFWEAEDAVAQFHPPASKYVNLHPHCLHLWKKVGTQFDMPDPITVGPLKSQADNPYPDC